MGKTNFDRITASPEALASFLASLPCLDAPWDDDFHRIFCDNCPMEDCPKVCPARSGAEQPGVVAVTFARSEPMKNRDNAGLHTRKPTDPVHCPD